jgi:hypothetical protein
MSRDRGESNNPRPIKGLPDHPRSRGMTLLRVPSVGSETLGNVRLSDVDLAQIDTAGGGKVRPRGSVVTS